MDTPILPIVDFVVKAFLHIWPYLLVTIPLAVAVQMSGASRYIKRAFQGHPMIAILLATFVGAFSPFCSCGVIPVIAALLISGVPLAPVMSFWIASPSMDPEAFFLSVAALGWELAVWRLCATLMLSLAAGFVTHFMVQRGWLGTQLLNDHVRKSNTKPSLSVKVRQIWQGSWQTFKRYVGSSPLSSMKVMRVALATSPASCAETTVIATPSVPVSTENAASCFSSSTQPVTSCGCGCGAQPATFWQRLLVETRKATTMVIKFMALAFFLEALIELYVPSGWIASIVGQNNPFAILIAVLLGVPAYASNMAALPMMSGLLAQGMNPAAALAFLVAGPTTTLPAMAAVWGIANRRVFVLYVSISLIGALLAGYIYHFALLSGM